MKLTPLDIRKQEFARRVRGVDEDEVQAFLQMVATQWEEIQDEHRHLEDKVRDLEAKLDHYRRVEEALQEALRTARESAKEVVETARRKAQLMLDEAEVMATDVKRDAEEERRKMRRQVSRLTQRRDEIVSRLRAFLISEMELLARFEGDDAIGFIKLLPAEGHSAHEQKPPVRTAGEEITQAESPLAPPVEEAEPEPVPLPPWAEFEDDDQPVAPFDDAPDGPPIFEADEEPDEGPYEPAMTDAGAGFSRTGDEETEASGETATFDSRASDGGEPPAMSGSIPEETGSRMQPPALDESIEVPATSGLEVPSHEEPEPEPAEDEIPASFASPVTTAVSNWINEHVRSPLRRLKEGSEGGPAETDDLQEIERDEAYGDGADERFVADESARTVNRGAEKEPEEEAENFTVSSEEVERIRRILKGLD